jgi:hypothetical protein
MITPHHPPFIAELHFTGTLLSAQCYIEQNYVWFQLETEVA